MSGELDEFVSVVEKPYLVIIESCDFDILRFATAAEACAEYERWAEIARGASTPMTVTLAGAVREVGQS